MRLQLTSEAILPRSGPLRLSRREFQNDKPATERAHGPSVLSRHRGTTKNSGSKMLPCWDVGHSIAKEICTVHRHLRSTTMLSLAGNCTLRNRVFTELCPVHRANEALSAEALYYFNNNNTQIWALLYEQSKIYEHQISGDNLQSHLDLWRNWLTGEQCY